MSEYINRSVTLPKELSDFADTKIRRLAKETGEPANLSKYIRDLIRADKECNLIGEEKRAA
jgi:Arc/MetJ-type ribon-helix-helix transcriptional regulator